MGHERTHAPQRTATLLDHQRLMNGTASVGNIPAAWTVQSLNAE
jgi:hypothetical protein